MSELKYYKLFHRTSALTSPEFVSVAEFGAGDEVYLKSEADKVIARQNVEIEEAVKTMKSLNSEIIELKDKCQMHNFFWEGCGFAKRGFKNTIAVSEAFDRLEAENAELKQKLEDVQASMYADVVDANMEVRRLKRALYIAHAIKAKFKLWWMNECKHNEFCKLLPDPRKIKKFTNSAWICSKSQEKCRAKAEEY